MSKTNKKCDVEENIKNKKIYKLHDGPCTRAQKKLKIQMEEKENLIVNKRKTETLTRNVKNSACEKISKIKLHVRSENNILIAGSSKETENSINPFNGCKRYFLRSCVTQAVKEERRILKTKLNKKQETQKNCKKSEKNVTNIREETNNNETVKEKEVPQKLFDNKGVTDLDSNTKKLHPNILYGVNLNDVMSHSYATENEYVLPSNFSKKITHIVKVRAMLINWLLKLQQYVKCDDGVFFINVRIFDKIVNGIDIRKEQVQLVGIASFWISMKFCNGVFAPKSHELVKLCSNEVSVSEIVRMERQILEHLAFHIHKDEPMLWVRYYLRKMQYDNCEIISFCSNYLLDCFVLDENSGTYRLSLQAAAAVHLSLELLGHDADESADCWLRIKHHPGYYNKHDLLPVKRKMLQMLQHVQDLRYEFREAFFKYLSEKYGGVSLLLCKKFKKNVNTT